MTEKNGKKSAVIIGAGLVGSLCACFMAKKGYKVTVYEKREDLRAAKIFEGRSINLALSHRGRKALREVDLESVVLKKAIPMQGRFLHKLNNTTECLPYDAISKQCIYSIGRNFLNETLLSSAEESPDVKFYFNHKLVGVNFENGQITICNTKKQDTFQITADIIIGADGAFSALRRFMILTPLFEFSQTYIEHGYIELCVPPERGHLMQQNYLHIWPRGEFMMIALPNQSGSWTVTLFMPFKKFEALNTERTVLEFFENTFPDALPLVGERPLIDTFFKTKPSTLVSIKCNPYHVGDRFLIIGDAAHAMVPFYGQGMNSGFEDCSILNQLFTELNDDIPKIIKTFTDIRKENAFAICNMAMYNYVEMRDLVNRPTYKLRKYFDEKIARMFPKKWIPMYNSVSFHHMGYNKCIENRKWQDMVGFLEDVPLTMVQLSRADGMLLVPERIVLGTKLRNSYETSEFLYIEEGPHCCVCANICCNSFNNNESILELKNILVIKNLLKTNNNSETFKVKLI